MATLPARPSEAASIRAVGDEFEPDDQWKTKFRAQIESGLYSMVADAKRNLEDKLSRAPVDEVTREILSKEHMEAMRNIRRIAQDQYDNGLERERQERRWAAGHQVDQEWSDALKKEQQSILDNIKRDDGQNDRSPTKSNNVEGSSRHHSGRWTPRTTPSATEREGSYFSQASSGEAETHGGGGGGGAADLSRRGTGVNLFGTPSSERPPEVPWKQSSSLVDEPEEMEQSPTRQRREESGSLRRTSTISLSKPIPEFWKPSISPEEDAAMSRTLSKARRGSTASISSSYRASGLNILPERSGDSNRTADATRPSESPDVSAHAERERIKREETERQWDEVNRAREREKLGQTRTDSRQSTGSSTYNQRLEDRLGVPSPVSATSASPTRPVDIPSRAFPPTSAGRPIVNKRSFTVDDPIRPPSSSPGSRAWAGPSRSPTDPRHDRSPQTPDDYGRPWLQGPALRSRLSSEAFRYGHGENPSFTGSRHVYHEESEESDDDLGDWQEHRALEAEAQAKKREAEAQRKEEDARRKEEEARRKEDEARRKEQEARRKEEDAKQKEEAARLKEEETRKKEEEIKKREEELRRREEEVSRREAEARRKEEDAKRKEEDAKRKEEEARRREEEVRRREEEKQKQQQDEFRKREEEIRRRADERKRQDSMNSDTGRGGSAYPSTSPPTSGPWPSNRGGPTTSPPSMASTPSSSSRGSTASSNWSSSTRGTNSTQPSSTSSRTATPSSNAKANPATSKPTPSGAGGAEAEWARRQAEQAKKQQEQFRKEQERLERERQAKAGKILTKEELLQLFEIHERQWSQVKTLGDLTWNSFPWPMLKRPSTPEDMTPVAISAYVLSPHYPDKTKSSKDRIKDHIRRWHPDRFESQILPKVVEEEKEKVKEGAGSVARCLNELLTRSNVHDVFS